MFLGSAQRFKLALSLEVLELGNRVPELEIHVSRVLELRVPWELGVPRERRVLENLENVDTKSHSREFPRKTRGKLWKRLTPSHISTVRVGKPWKR